MNYPNSQKLIEEGDLFQDELIAGHLRVPTLPYQCTLDAFQPWNPANGWPAYIAFLQRSWFRLYRERLLALGYQHDGIFETRRDGTFSYCHDTEGFSGFDGDDWWAQHRSNVRIVAAHGRSVDTGKPRPETRIRYHGDSLVYEFGEEPGELKWDKGHFIAHSIGGATDLGLFAQRRDVNQTRGEFGKLYRSMETYAQKHPGTFAFSRPIYGDGTEHPFFLEYGVLKEDRQWWVETFPNRHFFQPFRGFEHSPTWRRKLIPPTALDAHLRIAE